MVNTYFGRLTNEVILNTVGEENRKVLNNRIAMRVTKNHTTFIDIVAWEGTAELISKYFKKGNEILFQGRLINKKKLIGEGIEIDCHALLVDEIFFTHGNKKDNSHEDPEEDTDFI